MGSGKDREAITSAEAARELDVTAGQVRRHYREERLDGYRLDSGVVMIYRDSLDEFKRLRGVKYGKVGGWVSPDPPDNAAARRETFRGGKRKKKADMIEAGLKYREYMRNYMRRKRAEERAKAEGKGRGK